MTLYPSIQTRLRSLELLVPGEQWPIFIYKDNVVNEEDEWDGLFRSKLLVTVSLSNTAHIYNCSYFPDKAYKHIFTSPSSVEKETKSTRSGNARIHGMTGITFASLAYVATQVYDCRHPLI